ncbi:hypothetical protein ABTJ59_19765, partial [Acinetobacter baumannii]
MALTGHGAAGIGICRLRPGCARRLAPIETGKNGMHYLMVSCSLDEVGQACDIAQREERRRRARRGRW